MKFKVSHIVAGKAENLLKLLKCKYTTREVDGMVFVEIKTDNYFCSVMIDRTYVVSIFNMKNSLQERFVEMYSPEGVVQILNIYLNKQKN